ncbi:MAG TPA: DUF1003 domain-containing protein [Streptosporangiaceae bacterium]|nr:DUF1003 domain-containing protein [Streptosporangiaceae bacterium]
MDDHEHHLIRRHFGAGRNLGDRAADKFVAVFGSWAYIIWQTVIIVAWMAGNAWFLKQWGQDIGLRKVPDPYPFILLNLGFSAQASYAAPLILMAQNRQSERDKDFARHQFEIIERTDDVSGEVLALQRQQMNILGRLNSLDGKVADLAEVVRAVMAARAGHDSAVAADAKAARSAAESAFVATQALAAVATASPGPTELAAAVAENTEAVRQVHQAVTVPQPAPDPGPAGAKPRGKT